MLEKSLKERFLLHVKKTPTCWLWTGAKSYAGYGFFRLRNPRRQVSSHRFSYELFKGKIPEGLLVCHSCDNPSCVRPSHLWLGNYSSNALDSFRKGRGVDNSGVKNGMSKLTWNQVRDIRAKYILRQYSQSKLAREYGVVQDTICAVVSGKSWKE
jgi:hypothetical protein